MRWVRRGHVFSPDGRAPWARAYAFPPTPHPIGDGLLRIYAAFCDEHTVGRVGFVDVKLARPSEIVRVAERPVLDVGEPGEFDDNGVVPTCVLPVGDELFLYYTGYQRQARVPYSQLLGLAISRDGGESFERHARVPVLERSDAERTTRGSAHVVREGKGFAMYYSGGSGWIEHGGRTLPVYTIRRLESPDGVTWGPEGVPVIGFASEDEHAIARPWLVDPHTMLFSYRARSHDYRLGLATYDGTAWRRGGELDFTTPGAGWDSNAVAYGATVRHGAATYLFYCGNDRGRTGFGYAEPA